MTLAEEDAPDSAAEEKLSKSNTGKNTGRRIQFGSFKGVLKGIYRGSIAGFYNGALNRYNGVSGYIVLYS